MGSLVDHVKPFFRKIQGSIQVKKIKYLQAFSYFFKAKIISNYNEKYIF